MTKTNAELAAELREEATASGAMSVDDLLDAARRLEGEISEAQVTAAAKVLPVLPRETIIAALRAAREA